MNGVAAILLICLSAIVVNAKLTIIPENIDIFGDIEDYDVILGDAKIEEKNDETGIVTAFVTFPSEVSINDRESNDVSLVSFQSFILSSLGTKGLEIRDSCNQTLRFPHYAILQSNHR